MMNGLNILPTYTEYFALTPATVGLNTASVFIGSFFGTMVSGVLTDRLGRRPTTFWGAAVTLVGIVIQTAAQNMAMVSTLSLSLSLSLHLPLSALYIFISLS